jgi:hypothetical protein
VTDRAWDPGLQPERTALAWRRTGLALTVGSLIGLRVLPPLLGLAAYVLAGLGVVASLAVLWAAHRRYRRVHRLLVAARDVAGADDAHGGAMGSPSRLATTGGALPAVTAVLALAAGIGALVVTISVP